MENDFHHNRLNTVTKNITDGRAFRRKKSKRQREVNINTGKETVNNKTLSTYAQGAEKPTEKVVDLSQIYLYLLAGEHRSSKMDLSHSLCTNSNREREHYYFSLIEKEKSLYYPRKIKRYFPI